jgi:tetratricopeptide (TPR) repeat protein
VAAGWGWFLVAIAPYLGLKQNGLWPAWADRFMYLPLVGLAIAAAFGGWAALRSLPRARAVAAAVAAAALVPLALATHAQGAYWETPIALFGRAVEIEPGSADMNVHLGMALAGAGRVQDALVPLERAVRLQPSSAEARARYGLALVYAGRPGEAGAELEEALRLSPGLPDALFGRAQLLASLGLRSDARRAYLEFLERSPDTPELSAMRAEALRRTAVP